MIEQAALSVSSMAVAAAAIFATLKWDRQLGSFGRRFSLRTLLIVMAIAPPVMAGAWWSWQTLQTPRSGFSDRLMQVRIPLHSLQQP